jgi:hypothetical protein
MLGQTQALGNQLIEVGGADQAVVEDPKIAISHIVGHNEDHVWLGHALLPCRRVDVARR